MCRLRSLRPPRTLLAFILQLAVSLTSPHRAPTIRPPAPPTASTGPQPPHSGASSDAQRGLPSSLASTAPQPQPQPQPEFLAELEPPSQPQLHALTRSKRPPTISERRHYFRVASTLFGTMGAEPPRRGKEALASPAEALTPGVPEGHASSSEATVHSEHPLPSAHHLGETERNLPELREQALPAAAPTARNAGGGPRAEVPK